MCSYYNQGDQTGVGFDNLDECHHRQQTTCQPAQLVWTVKPSSPFCACVSLCLPVVMWSFLLSTNRKQFLSQNPELMSFFQFLRTFSGPGGYILSIPIHFLISQSAGSRAFAFTRDDLSLMNTGTTRTVDYQADYTNDQSVNLSAMIDRRLVTLVNIHIKTQCFAWIS